MAHFPYSQYYFSMFQLFCYTIRQKVIISSVAKNSLFLGAAADITKSQLVEVYKVKLVQYFG